MRTFIAIPILASAFALTFNAAAISAPGAANAEEREVGRFADHEQLVAETHAASLKLREQALRKTIARDTSWWAPAAFVLERPA